MQWLDFRRVLERETVDVERLRALAASSRAEVPLAAALRVARAVVGAPVPAVLADVPLPRALAARLRRCDEDPLAFVEPATVSLGRARLELLAGRRAALLWRTLVLPDTVDGDTRPFARARQAVSRAMRLGRGMVGLNAAAPVPAVPAAATASAVETPPARAEPAAAEPPEAR